MIERFQRLVDARPGLLVALAVLVVLPLAPFAPGVPLDNSNRVWMLQDPARTGVYERFLAAFGSDERVLAVVRGPGAREDASLLRFVSDLHDALLDGTRFPGVLEVVSIKTLAPDEVMLALDPELGGWAEIARLRGRLEGGPLNRSFRLLDLGRDRASVGIALRKGAPAERRALARELESFCERARREGRELLLAGEPLVNVALDDGSRQVDTTFLPLLVGACVASMLALTRSVRITLLALAAIGLTVLFVTGVVGASGRSFNLILVIVKPLLLVLTLATSLHVAQSYVQGIRDGLDRPAAVARAVKEKLVPCFFTTVAAVDGFGSLVTARVVPIREFGVVAALGMLAAFVLVVGLVLGALRLLGPTRVSGEGRQDRGGAAAEWLARRVTASPARAVATVLGGIALGAVGALALGALPVDTNAINYFPREQRVRREYQAIEQEGYGLFSAELVLRHKDGIAIGGSVPVLASILELERAARELPGVTATLSFADVLSDGSWRGSGREGIPDASIVRDALAREETRARTRSLLGEGEGAAARAIRVTVLGPTRETPRLLELTEGLEALASRIAGPRGLEGEVTGSFPLLLRTQLSLLGTLARSLTTAIVTIGITLLVLVRSPRRALLAALPNALPILLNFELMRLTDTPLDVGTVMTSSIVLGIAVDNAIHYLYHYDAARRRGEDRREATAYAGRVAGRSLVLATLVVCAGFATLLLSDFGPTRRFGALSSAGLLVALAGTLVVLPALLVLFDSARELDDRVEEH